MKGDYFRFFESGLPSQERNKRWIMVLAHIDASGMGNKEKDPFLVLAGFVTTAKNWSEFSDAWQAELDKHPAIDYFKLNEAFYPKHDSQFKGWKKKEINKKIDNLVNIIKSTKHLIRVVSYIDKWEDEQLIIKQSPKKRIDHPYYLCFLHIIVEIISRQYKLGFKYPTNFIFDEEGSLGYDCLSWFNYYKKTRIPKHAWPYFGSVTFGNDKQIVALQAADLYSGLYRRHLFDNKKIFMPMSSNFKLLQEMPAICDLHLDLKELSIYIQEQEIKQLLEKMKK